MSSPSSWVGSGPPPREQTGQAPCTEAAALPFRLCESRWLAAHQRASKEARLGRSRARIGEPWKMREAEGEKLEHFTLIKKKCQDRPRGSLN